MAFQGLDEAAAKGAPTCTARGVTGEAAFALLTWGWGASAGNAAQLFASSSMSPKYLLMPKVVYKDRSKCCTDLHLLQSQQSRLWKWNLSYRRRSRYLWWSCLALSLVKCLPQESVKMVYQLLCLLLLFEMWLVNDFTIPQHTSFHTNGADGCPGQA